MLDLLDLCEPAYRAPAACAPAASAPATSGNKVGQPATNVVAQRQDDALVSILLPVHAPPIGYLARAVSSVLAQSHTNWQLIVADDASPGTEVRTYLESLRERDARIEVHYAKAHGHIVRTTNLALKSARGQWITFLDQDDELAPHALATMLAASRQQPRAKLLYSDEDRIDAFGQRFMPYCKPAWSPDLLLAQNYICHLAFYDGELLRKLGGLRPGTEGSQDHDLALRASRCVSADQIVHVPYVCYHWRTLSTSTATFGAAVKPYALAAGLKAINDHLAQSDPGATASIDRGFYRVQRRADARPRAKDVAVVPTHSHYTAEDINQAVAATTGDCIVLHAANASFANEADVTRIVSTLIRPDVGCVTWKIVTNDSVVAQVGHVLHPQHGSRPALSGYPAASDGYFGRGALQHNVAATTRLALAVRRADWQALGGFSPKWGGTLADVDFCLRLRASGRVHVACPFIVSRLHGPPQQPAEQHTLWHGGVKGEGGLNDKAKNLQQFCHQWRAILADDPYASPHLQHGATGTQLIPQQTLPPQSRFARLATS